MPNEHCRVSVEKETIAQNNLLISISLRDRDVSSLLHTGPGMNQVNDASSIGPQSILVCLRPVPHYEQVRGRWCLLSLSVTMPNEHCRIGAGKEANSRNNLLISISSLIAEQIRASSSYETGNEPRPRCFFHRALIPLTCRHLCLCSLRIWPWLWQQNINRNLLREIS
jgi:hypothetical protein